MSSNFGHFSVISLKKAEPSAFTSHIFKVLYDIHGALLSSAEQYRVSSEDNQVIPVSFET